MDRGEYVDDAHTRLPGANTPVSHPSREGIEQVVATITQRQCQG